MEQKLGEVIHFYPKVNAAAILLTDGDLAVGDVIRISGHGMEFEQRVESLELDRQPVQRIAKGCVAAIKVVEKVRPGAIVCKIG